MSYRIPFHLRRNKVRLEHKLISLYILFWSFWLVYDILAGYKLGWGAYFVIILSFIGFGVGRIARFQSNTLVYEVFDGNSKIKFFLRIIIIINLIILYFSIKSMLEIGWSTRDLSFTDAGQFGNIWLTFVSNNVFGPLTLSGVVIAVAASNEEVQYYIYAYVILFIMAASSLGRFPIYYMIYFQTVIIIIRESKKRVFTLRHFSSVFFIIILTYGAWKFLEIKLLNGSELSLSLVDIVKMFLLNYHLIGFHTLDQVISSDYLTFDSVFPTTSLGIIGWDLHLLTKYSNVLPVFPNSYMILMENFNGGMYYPEFDWSYNAFTTHLLPYYADGGFFGVFMMSVIIGLLSTTGRLRDIYTIDPVFLLVVFLLTFSLFMPFINSTLPATLFFIWLFNRSLNCKSKSTKRHYWPTDDRRNPLGTSSCQEIL